MMAGNTEGNVFGPRPTLGSKTDRMHKDTVIALLKRLLNQSGLGGFSFGYSSGFNVYDEKSADKIGYLGDSVNIPYEKGINSILAFLNTGYYHIHGTSFVYPNHADGVTLTAGGGAWDLTGAITEIIPADTLLPYNFDLHWMNVDTISANGMVQIDIYAGESGSEVLIVSTRATRTAVQSFTGPKRIQIPQQPAGMRISCRASDSTAGALTCVVSLEGHYYTIIGE